MKKFKDEAIEQMYQKVDGGDIEGFLSYFAPDIVFIFGSDPAVHGKEGVKAFADAMLSQIDGVKHDLLDVWDLDGNSKKLIKGEVIYMLKSGNTTSFPFLNIVTFKDNLITEYLIYADPRPLFQNL